MEKTATYIYNGRTYILLNDGLWRSTLDDGETPVGLSPSDPSQKKLNELFEESNDATIIRNNGSTSVQLNPRYSAADAKRDQEAAKVEAENKRRSDRGEDPLPSPTSDEKAVVPKEKVKVSNIKDLAPETSVIAALCHGARLHRLKMSNMSSNLGCHVMCWNVGVLECVI